MKQVLLCFVDRFVILHKSKVDMPEATEGANSPEMRFAAKCCFVQVLPLSLQHWNNCIASMWCPLKALS